MTPKTRFSLRPRRGLLIAMTILLIMLVAYFAAPDVFELGELRLLDWRMRLRGPRSPGELVKLILIDSRSLAAYGLNHNMRFALADVIDGLCADKPLAVGLDLFFVPDASPGDDPSRDRLAQAIRSCGRVAVGYNWSKDLEYGRLAHAEALGRRRLLDATRDPEESGFTPEHIPDDAVTLDPLVAANAASAGFFTVISDPMNTARKIPAALMRDNLLYFPFSLALVRTALSENRFHIDVAPDRETISGPYLKDLKLYPDPSGYLWFNHYGSASAFPSLSFIDAVQTGIPKDFAAGSVVLIGVSGPESNDLFITPFDTAMPGVALHAAAVANALADGFLLRDNLVRAIEVVVMTVFALILGLFLPRVAPIQANAIAPVCALAFLALAHELLAKFAIWLQIICPLMLLGITHGVILSVRLYYAERLASQTHSEIISEFDDHR